MDVWLQRKFQVETEVENWIQKFDADMGERQVRNPAGRGFRNVFICTCVRTLRVIVFTLS